MTTSGTELEGSGSLVSEITVRVFLWVTFIYMELCAPNVRLIQPEELWMYKYPHMNERVSSRQLWAIVLAVPMTVLTVDYLWNRNTVAYKRGLLALTLLLALNGCSTILLKLLVGRPRPDFYYRCFPGGEGDSDLNCTGNEQTILEGRKSFPSGHASFAFASMVFTTLFLSKKLLVFRRHRGSAWRMMVCLLPIVLAAGIAVSRICDHCHHWEDVTVGSILGGLLANLCFTQYRVV